MFKYTKDVTFNNNTSHGLIASKILPDSRVLEFGCGKGDLAKFIKSEKNCRVVGIDIDESAIKMAGDSLERGIVANAESDVWESVLSGECFDVLVFSDVLEHLHSPASLIKKALKYLKEDGKIIFSVPNIAHGDIVTKLMQGRFDYTDTGLLDNTHIHFFALENIYDLCKECSVFITALDATYALPGTTEQMNEYYSHKLEYLQKTSCVYQFVGEAYKENYAKRNALVHSCNVKRLPFNSITVYYDVGRGINNDDKTVVFIDDPANCATTVSLNKNTTRIRVDFVEDSDYVLKDVSFELDGEAVSPSLIVGATQCGNDYIIDSADSQFYFDTNGACSVFIKASIIPLYNAGSIVKLFSTVSSEATAAKEETVKMENELNETKCILEKTRQHADNLSNIREKLTEDLKYLKLHYETAMAQREDLKRQVDFWQNNYNTISTAACWKITKPLRVLLDLIKKPFKSLFFLRLRRGFRCLKENGLKYTLKKIKQKLNSRKATTTNIYTEDDLKKQRCHKFEKDVKFSIVVPLYNTSEGFLREMMDSVIKQTYSNWELCLADGSDDKHEYISRICEKYQKADHRIRYKKLEKNLGISENTNACLSMASGDYIGLFDHDDLLHPAALYEIMNAICNEGADFIYTDETTFHDKPSDAFWPHFKPDFSPDTLRSYNYICHFTVFKASLLEKTGPFRKEFDGSQDYDMILRLTENAEKIVHIPIILYYWRAHKNSVASDISAKPYTLDAARRALSEHLERVGLTGRVSDSRIPSTYKIDYAISDNPLVSIIIPNKDHSIDLDKCLSSIYEKSTYKNFEVIIVENNSTEQETFDYYQHIEGKYDNLKVVYWAHEFNYSKINNFGFQYASGDHVVLLNNDIEFITDSWIEQMLMFSQRKDVGATGMMLYYDDDTVQHAGVIIGIGGVAGHSHKYFKRGDYGYASRLAIAQNLSAVTAACVMIRSDVFREVGGLDESFAVAFNDVDLCLRIRKAGYLVVFTPYAEAYHYESKSRGLEDTVEKQMRFKKETENFFSKWQEFLGKGDPYYNKNLTLERENFTLR